MTKDICFTVTELTWIKSILGCSRGNRAIHKNRLVSSSYCGHLQSLVDVGVLELDEGSVYGRGTYLYTVSKEWLTILMELLDLRFSTKFK